MATRNDPELIIDQDIYHTEWCLIRQLLAYCEAKRLGFPSIHSSLDPHRTNIWKTEVSVPGENSIGSKLSTSLGESASLSRLFDVKAMLIQLHQPVCLPESITLRQQARRLMRKEEGRKKSKFVSLLFRVVKSCDYGCVCITWDLGYQGRGHKCVITIKSDRLHFVAIGDSRDSAREEAARQAFIYLQKKGCTNPKFNLEFDKLVKNYNNLRRTNSPRNFNDETIGHNAQRTETVTQGQDRPESRHNHQTSFFHNNTPIELPDPTQYFPLDLSITSSSPNTDRSEKLISFSRSPTPWN